MGDQVCILRIRYIQEKSIPVLNEKVSSIQNQIVAIEEINKFVWNDILSYSKE